MSRRPAMHARGALAVACLALLLAGTAAATSLPALAEAQRAEGQRSEPGVLMSERAYRRFEALTDMYGEGRYQAALESTESWLRGDLNDYERAMGEQLAGYLLISLERLAAAVPRFEQAIALDALPNAAHFGLMRSLAQLYASLERWQDSLDMMTAYLSFRPEPTAEDRIMMAQNLAQLGRFEEALPWVRAAIDSAGGEAQESWFQLELAVHVERRDWRAALEVLRTVLARWPERLQYWEMKAGAHQELGEDREALSALLAAYHAGLITQQDKLLNLARLSLYVELPYLAGRILSEGMAAGRVQRNEANLQLLLQAWTAAREFERAVAVIDQLAPMAGRGELFMQKARLMMEQNRWQATVEAARQALDIGNLDDPGAAWLLIGIAQMELDELRQARQSLQRAQEFDADSRRQAREWQRFVEERIQVADLQRSR